MNQKIADILIQAAREGGKVLKKYFDKDLEISRKTSAADIVTNADIESQKIIVETITNLMIKNGLKKEEIGFIGEESLNKQAKHTFIIDPLDGTATFALSEDRFTVSIAYSIDKKIQAGVVYQPIREVIYFAEKKHGSYLFKNGEKVKLEIKHIPLSESVVAMHISTIPSIAKKIFDISSKLVPDVIRIRERGCASLSICDLTQNKYQSVFNGQSCIWDIAAAKIIIEEANGQITDWLGNEINLDLENLSKYYQFIAGHPQTVNNMLPYFAKHA